MNAEIENKLQRFSSASFSFEPRWFNQVYVRDLKTCESFFTNVIKNIMT